MRYIMKGGVWKNSEDEILKAAIMKYGLNQWSRISSLLQRKSAKQCKQRWYEWLDPSIKKTQWTRGEDEKLLQLARVFPSQWRTIAPFVGRTPTQCYERYEKLLDIAQGKSVKEAYDLRKLRPGQIDPNPETKPARLDPIDMDEDEKEMLAEVRVRLANTKGKKAKRKEREKIIEQARRLAQLQKIRQLDMAGVDNIPTAKQIKRMKQRKDLNYNIQIPFKRDAPEFVYKAEGVQTPKNVSFASTITLQTLEGKRRDVEEELQRKLDKRRMKKYKERDLKSMLRLRNPFERPSAFPIKLPEPQINEKDLQNMKKFNITTPLNTYLLSGSDTPYGMTPHNKILYSAKVSMSLNHQQMTPLDEEFDGVEGLQYLKQMENNKGGMRAIDRVISQRMKTPANEWEEDHGKVKSLFKNMRKPQNIIEFEIPQEQQQDEPEQLLDAEQIQKINQQKQKKQEDDQLRLQTQVIKRKLPRPYNIPTTITPASQDPVTQLVEREMVTLIYSDSIDNPREGVIFPENMPYKQYFSYEQLQQARQLIDETLPAVLNEYNFQQAVCHKGRKLVKLDFNQKQAKIMGKVQGQLEKEVNQKYESYKLNFEQYKSHLRRVQSNEKKTRRLLTGYEKLIRARIDEINILQKQCQNQQIERTVYEHLEVKEKSSMDSRMWELELYYRLIYNSL